MSKQNQKPASPLLGPTAVMVAGGLVVAGLVGWALTRSVEPKVIVSDTIATTQPASPITLTPPPGTSTGFPNPTATSTANPSSFSISEHGQEPEKASVNRVSAEDLKARFERGEVTVIDVRPIEAYESGHIAGSLGIPMASMESQLDQLPKGKPIVTYCT